MTGIRCDANSIIASGHMMRCLTVAKELVRLGESVTFFVADEESGNAFRSMASGAFDDAGADGAGRVSVAVLNSNWQDMEAELPALAKELSARNTEVLLVDSYRATASYFEKLKELCPVACFDDLHEDIYPVDVLINYSGYYKQLGYEESYRNVTGHCGEPTRLLLGLQYAPLREQFYGDDEEKNLEGSKSAGDAAAAEKGTSILLASGGADGFGMLLGTLLAAEKNGLIGEADTVINWHVVAGALCMDIDALNAFAADHPGVHIHRAVADMAGLMRQCDLAVCAAGTMLTECAAVKLPAIFYQVADNQKYNVDFFENTGGMMFAGDVAVSKEKTIQKICDKVNAVLTGDEDLIRMKSALNDLTDGRGAVRIAEELVALERKTR